MKLLFDANLSPRLVERTRDAFPGSTHVFDCGAIHGDDGQIWGYAKRHGLVIVSKDSDFHQMSVLFGAPPKVIWIRSGNASTDVVARLLLANEDWIAQFIADEIATFLVI